MVLAAFMALAMTAHAQTFAGITAEQNAQNTPDGWTAVNLPVLPEITSANTITVTGLSETEDNTKAIQAALDKVPTTGGMVVIPAGTWLFGSSDQMTSSTEVLSIKSKTVLHLCAGATLKLVEYGKAPNNKTLFIGCKNKNQSDIVIEGEGTTSVIDGQGARWWKARDNKETFNPGAMIRFEKGSRFLVRNLKIQNTPGVNLTLSNSNGANHFTVHDVTISNPASDTKTEQPSHNTDGISIWGHHVNIYDCNICTGDDNVVCDSYAQYVHVWNCYFGTGHGASIGSYTSNVKHLWFDQITMVGTTSGIRMKTGINTDGTLRGGGEEDWKFTNFTMTKIPSPFSIDCYYDKQYSSDPATDEANARTKDSTTPTYNGILLQNVKTTDVCTGKAIFLVGRPESHIQNVTLDNVQISAKTGIDIRFVDNLVFKNGSKITVSSGKMWVTNYGSTYDDQCNATSTDVTPDPSADSYVLNSKTFTDGSAPTAAFSNGFSITNTKSKSYSVGSGTNYIKYSANVQYTIVIPDGIKIAKMVVEGKNNYTEADAYLGEVNGVSYEATDYVFPASQDVKNYDFTFSTPVEHSLTFTPMSKQCLFGFTLYPESSSGIAGILTASNASSSNVYDMGGRLVKANASSSDLGSLAKGVYIYNHSKFVKK